MDRDIEMLDAISGYHGFSKSAMITSLVRKEFWRIFPAGTAEIKPDDGAAVAPVETRRARGARKERKP